MYHVLSYSIITEIELTKFTFYVLFFWSVTELLSNEILYRLPDDMKQLAQEACDCLRQMLGIQTFVQVYSEIRKTLKAKRDKRKQGEKIMAVVNPMRNAKRKLRIAAKHRAHKKKKIMTMKFGRWL